MLNDSAVHAPPTAGAQNYNAMTKPALGASYVDSVFGETVVRLTDTEGLICYDKNYAFHNINADGTLSFHWVGNDFVQIIRTSDGTTYKANQPLGNDSREVRWSMTDPDKYYYWSGAALVRRNLAAQTDTTIHTFPSTLELMGGSANYQDRTDTYFIVKYSGTAKLWKFVGANTTTSALTGVLYTNAVTPLDANGWVSITPDGNFIVTAAGPTAADQKEHYSYAVNHGTQTVSPTPVQYWGSNGDHGTLISASNGHNYWISSAAYCEGSVMRIDLEQNMAGLTCAQQVAANTILIPFAYSSDDYQFSSVSVGANADWTFMASVFYSDSFGSAVAPWTYPWKQEIVAINAVTLEVRRFAHHRSRGITGAGEYFINPRVSCSPDGSFVLWASDFNDSTPSGYADLYGIANPLGISGGGTPPAPAGTFSFDDSGYPLPGPQGSPTTVSVF